jgi:hypothetical protein
MANTQKQELRRMVSEFRKLFEAQRETAEAQVQIAEAGLVTANEMAVQVALLPDDGEPPLPVLDIHDAAPVRAGETAEFRVTLSDAQPGADVSVEWDTADGEAGGIASFHGEDAEYIIDVETDQNETPGAFEVILSNPNGATIGRATATGTILPAEPALPVLDIHDAAPVRAGETAEFRVTLSRASTATVTVDVGQEGAWTTLNLAIGVVEVPIAVMTSGLPTGTVTLGIRNPVNATIGRAFATGTILPAEPYGPTPEFDLVVGPTPEAATHRLDLGQTIRGPGKLVLSLSGENPSSLRIGGVEAANGVLVMRRVAEAVNNGNTLALYEVDLAAGESVEGSIAVATEPPESLIGHVQWWPGLSGTPVSISHTTPDARRNSTDGNCILALPSAGARIYTVVADNGNLPDVWSAPDMTEAMDVASSVSGGHGQGVFIRKGCPAGDFNTAVKRSAPAARLLAIAAAWDAGDPVVPAKPPVEPPPVDPPPTNGDVGPIEPVNPGKPQVAISVGTTPRNEWHACGWGCGSHNHAAASLPKLKQNVRKLCEDMNATVVRFFTPEKGAAFVTAYKPIWDLVREHGVDTVFSSSYIYSSAHDGGTPNPVSAANGIDAAIKAGITPTTWAATIQNEPDTPEGKPYGSNEFTSGVLKDQVAFRDRLNALGRQSVITLGLEWRHPNEAGRLQREFDMHEAQGQIPSVLQGGLIHIYDNGPTHTEFDNRWLKKGRGLWSTETGYMGANAIARFMAGINDGGTSVELMHIGQAARDDEKVVDQTQKLVAASGEPRPWYHAVAALSRELHRDTVMRLCTSNVAGRMRWVGWNTQHQAVCGKRLDGKWLVAGNAFSGEAQMTVTIPELASRSVVMTGRRVGQGGSVSSAKANMVGGVVRFTLGTKETIELVG